MATLLAALALAGTASATTTNSSSAHARKLPKECKVVITQAKGDKDVIGKVTTFNMSCAKAKPAVKAISKKKHTTSGFNQTVDGENWACGQQKHGSKIDFRCIDNANSEDEMFWTYGRR